MKLFFLIRKDFKIRGADYIRKSVLIFVTAHKILTIYIIYLRYKFEITEDYFVIQGHCN